MSVVHKVDVGCEQGLLYLDHGPQFLSPLLGKLACGTLLLHPGLLLALDAIYCFHEVGHQPLLQ